MEKLGVDMKKRRAGDYEGAGIPAVQAMPAKMLKPDASGVTCGTVMQMKAR
jgi:hypothetical protein